MPDQDRSSFGDQLRTAIRRARTNQAELARKIHTDPGQISRWVNDRALPHISAVREMSRALGVDLTQALETVSPEYELYVSAPISALEENAIAAHNDMVSQVVDSASRVVNGLYWPGDSIRSAGDLLAPDLVTERNLRVLPACSALLYVQFVDVSHPSGSLVELGIALGRKTRTTIILGKNLHKPYMLEGFAAVAERSSEMPKARIYEVNGPSEAVALIERNGRELLGLG